MEKRPPALALGPLKLTLLLLLWLVVFPAAKACPSGGSRCRSCPPDGSQCRNCIVNQMKFSCPECTPVLRCMARCLWGGNSRANCIKNCDCGTPKLSDCKRCMSRCKCSCMLS